MRRTAFLLVLLLASSALADPPTLEIPAEIKPVGGYVIVTPKGTAKAVSYVGLSGIDPMPSVLLKDPRMFALPVAGIPQGRYKFRAVGSLNDEHATVEFEVLIGDSPLPPTPQPPNPPGPNPPAPPGPTPPVPVTSFRVLLVYEANQVLPGSQAVVLWGKVVEEFLIARTTKDGTSPGFRRVDKDTLPGGDLPTMNALWSAVKPKVTQTPCLAVEVNGKVTIEPFPADPASALALLKKHLGEK